MRLLHQKRLRTAKLSIRVHYVRSGSSAVTLPQIAQREFFNLAQWLNREVEELNKRYAATKGRVDVARTEDNKIKINKNDWPSYHFSLKLTSDGKQLEISCSSRRSQSENCNFRPVILKLGMEKVSDFLCKWPC